MSGGQLTGTGEPRTLTTAVSQPGPPARCGASGPASGLSSWVSALAGCWRAALTTASLPPTLLLRLIRGWPHGGRCFDARKSGVEVVGQHSTHRVTPQLGQAPRPWAGRGSC